MRADRQTDRMTDSTTTVCLSSSALGIISSSALGIKMVVVLNQTTTLYLVIAAKVNIDLYDFIIDLYMTRPH